MFLCTYICVQKYIVNNKYNASFSKNVCIVLVYSIFALLTKDP